MLGLARFSSGHDHPDVRVASAALALLLGSLGVARADPPPTSPLTAEEREFFAWWDGLGYPDVGSLPFVRAWVGDWIGHGNSDPVAQTTQGFLVHEEGPKFRVFLTDLSVFEGTSKEEEDRPWARIGFERVDLESFVRAGLDGLARQGPEIPWFDKSDPFDAHRWSFPNQAFRIAVLARACAGRGLDDLAHRMCDRARFEQTRPLLTQQLGPDDPTPRAGFDSLKTWIRSESRHVFESGFGDPEKTWADLLVDAERDARAFAPERLRDDGNGDVAVLRRMVAAAAARRAGPPKPEPRTEPERIAALVDGLQDVAVTFVDSWGLWFQDPGPDRPALAHDHLEALGFAAVPALIAALDDVRFTRVVEYQETGKGQFRGSVDVLRVGELAWRILDRISGKALSSTSVGGPPTSRQPTRRRAATEWFERAKERGEIAFLVEQVEEAGQQADVAAKRLARLDPAAAVAAIEKGVSASPGFARHNLVVELVAIEGEVSTATLLRLLPRLADSTAGVAAASALWRRGRREGLDDLIRRWKAPPPADAMWWGREHLARALAETGHVDAVRALGEGLAERPTRERLDVVETFVLQPAEPGEVAPFSPPRSPEWEREIEALLASRLDDEDRVEGQRIGSDRAGVDPVVGEWALRALASRDPKRWSFDPKAPARERQTARVAAANAWRASRGLDPVAPTRRAVPAPIPLPSIRAVVDRALGSSASEDRRKALEEIEAKGLAAVPALREALAAAPGDAPGRADLDRLGRRLSFVVSEVVAEPVNADVAEALRSSQGRTLSNDLWWGIWEAFRKGSTLSGALRLRAERDAPEAGVRLVATWSSDTSGVLNPSRPGITVRFPRIRRGDHAGLSQGSAWGDLESGRKGIFGSLGLDEEIAETGWDDEFVADGEMFVQR
jgi:hypothetical protein